MNRRYTSPEWELRRYLRMEIVTVSTDADYDDKWDQYEEEPVSDATEAQD